jgi:hypothetical protein
VARSETREADSAYVALAKATSYIAPFEERMRMKELDLTMFHWDKQVPRLTEDAESIDAIVADVTARTPRSRALARLPEPKRWLDAARRSGPGLLSLKVSPADPRAVTWTVTATFAAPVPRGAAVRVLYRTFNSQGADWTAVDAAATGAGRASWSASVPGTHEGGMFAVEVDAGPAAAWRYPDVLTEQPYKAVAP